MSLLVVLPILLAPFQAKPEPRYEVETLYVIHKNVTAKNYKRIEALFSKAYPKLDLAKLKPKEQKRKEYFGLFHDRLLRQVAPDTDSKRIDSEQAWNIVREQVERE